MLDIFEYLREKFDRLADRIMELLRGSNGYRVVEIKAWVPDVRRTIYARLAKRLPPSGGHHCDRY